MMLHLSISQLTKDYEAGNWKLHARATSIIGDGWQYHENNPGVSVKAQQDGWVSQFSVGSG
jgi:hypothetical protein